MAKKKKNWEKAGQDLGKGKGQWWHHSEVPTMKKKDLHKKMIDQARKGSR